MAERGLDLRESEAGRHGAPSASADRAAAVKGWGAGRIGWLALPLALLVLVVFDLPQVLTLAWSFRDAKTDAVTLQHYGDFFTNDIYARVIWRTFVIAGVVTLSTALLGYPLAYWISRLRARARMIALALVVLPFWVSILVRTYAWIVILGNGGIVNRWLQASGVTETPISFLYNSFGVTLGMINVLLPFLVLPLYAAMVRVDDRLVTMAETLGASRTVAFWRVFFPLTLPALAASMILVFILSIGFYITPAILGGGKVPMIANMMDLLINRFPRWELAATISVVLLLLTLVLFWAYQWLRQRIPG